MSFIQLTSPGGWPVWINMQVVRSMNLNSNGEMTELWYVGTTIYASVQETPEQILELMNTPASGG